MRNLDSELLQPRALLAVSCARCNQRDANPDCGGASICPRAIADIEAHMLAPKCEEAKRLQDWVHGGLFGVGCWPPQACWGAHHLLQQHPQDRNSQNPSPALFSSCSNPSACPPLAGVADALERRYLRKLFFGFSRDQTGKDLLEEVRCMGGQQKLTAGAFRSARNRRNHRATTALLQYVFTFSYDDNGDVHMAAGTSSKQKFSTRDARRKVGASFLVHWVPIEASHTVLQP